MHLPYKLTQQLLFFSSIIIIIPTGILFIANSIPFFRHYLESLGLINDNIHDMFLTAISLLLVVISLKIGTNVNELLKLISIEGEKRKDVLISKGPKMIYENVFSELKKFRLRKTTVNIDILGYTMFSVVDELRNFDKEKLLKKMNINLYHLSEQFINDSPDIDSMWAVRLKMNLSQIEQFKDEKKEHLEKNSVSINTIPYDHIPAVHGFSLDGGSKYIAFASWNKNKQIDHPDNSVYIKVRANDRSEKAERLNELFQNWVKAADEEEG